MSLDSRFRCDQLQESDQRLGDFRLRRLFNHPENPAPCPNRRGPDVRVVPAYIEAVLSLVVHVVAGLLPSLIFEALAKLL